MNIKKIIKEEMDDFDWVKGEGLEPLLFELQDEDHTYKIWFGSIDNKEQQRIIDKLVSIGLIENRKWLEINGFDSLYFSYYSKHMGWGNKIHQWNVSHMGCGKTYGAPPHMKKSDDEWDSDKFGSSWRCREDGASHGEGLISDREFFDEETNRNELSKTLLD